MFTMKIMQVVLALAVVILAAFMLYQLTVVRRELTEIKDTAVSSTFLKGTKRFIRTVEYDESGNFWNQ